jgi:NAD(P)-dependent dehydrogenase (short-subunit alcohol dehydrogenase family)
VNPADRHNELAIAIRMGCAAAGARLPIVVRDESPAALALTARNEALDERAGDIGIGTVLHLAADASPATASERAALRVRESGAAPAAVAVAGQALFAVAPDAPLAWSWLRLLTDRALRNRPDPAPRSGRLAGRSVLITGSAQGFGRGIAAELLAQGACVLIADVNAALGRVVADQMCREAGEGVAVFCEADVTSEESMRRCVAEAVRAFGGVDLFVSNAGILKAGSIEEMDVKSFDLVTAVNYRGYFLGVKAVAPVMQAQHRLHAGHVMDIIQINSKSGLEGSNRNFAYAGGKFGGIGLTASFALELVEHGIKVNAICPGNYFDGPLWSDPEKGLFAQYLRAGKVPGARTVEDVRKFYTDKVPMRRGCTPTDVAKAILYLHEQEYETGQALPVTGGQVMLH